MADQPNAVEPVAPRVPRHRSPNYPSMGLRSAVSKIESLYKGGAINPLMQVSALKLLGYDKLHGEAGRVLSALKSFGLIEETKDDRIKLSQRGIDITARPPSDHRRQEALQQAAHAPAIYRELLQEYPGGLPIDAAMKSELIAVKRFNPNSVDGFLQDFRDSLEFAGISDVSMLKLDGEQHKEEISPVRPVVGDYVQWESAGQEQFPEPKRIRAFSPDGQWAFVDGSDTGLAVEELTVTETPSVEKIVEQPSLVAPPKLPTSPKPEPARTAQSPKMRSYSWALSGDFNAKLDLFGDAQTEEDIDALADYVDITIKALKRSLKAREQASQKGGE